jgi:hypothetical protein
LEEESRIKDITSGTLLIRRRTNLALIDANSISQISFPPFSPSCTLSLKKKHFSSNLTHLTLDIDNTSPTSTKTSSCNSDSKSKHAKKGRKFSFSYSNPLNHPAVEPAKVSCVDEKKSFLEENMDFEDNLPISSDPFDAVMVDDELVVVLPALKRPLSLILLSDHSNANIINLSLKPKKFSDMIVDEIVLLDIGSKAIVFPIHGSKAIMVPFLDLINHNHVIIYVTYVSQLQLDLSWLDDQTFLFLVAKQ